MNSIVETFLAANSDHAIEETKRLFSKNGEIFLMLNGQKLNKKDHMLWTFIDTITDRILHMAYLMTSNSKIFSEIMLKIQDKYVVPIKSIVFNHQLSLVKTLKEAFPGFPHQYCHFHFLKNSSRSISPFDLHLHVELAKCLNKLAYYRLNAPDIDFIINNTTYNIKNMVSMILEDITRPINRKSRNFDFFNGFELYNYQKKFIDMIKIIQSLISDNNKFYKILLKIENTIKIVLKQNKNLYNNVRQLAHLFNEIRDILSAQNKNSNEVKKREDPWS
ncbi:MAG: hypothetical protein ACTSPQ_02710 [Candidatus Helarchaeota archaeon]